MHITKTPLAAAALALAVSVAPVHAQSPAADVGAGQKRAAACFACHGADGQSKLPGTPHLAGQRRDYLEKALRAYREGTLRQDPTMTAMARPLTDADIVNIAAYFSQLVRRAEGVSKAEGAAVLASDAGTAKVLAATTPTLGAAR